jgi:hypothetical protein
VPPTALCVAWRADDDRPVVRSFVDLVTSVAGHAQRDHGAVALA